MLTDSEWNAGFNMLQTFELYVSKTGESNVAELVPGFFVDGEFGILAVGGEHYVDSAFQGFGRDYVPNVGFDYVGGYEVYLVLGVGDAVVGYVALVGASAFVLVHLTWTRRKRPLCSTAKS